jgi:hypothetical protein
MAKEQDEPAFRVTDRRLFGEEGETRKPDPEPEKQAPAAAAERAPSPEAALPGDEMTIDFPSYILGYYTQGLVLLGDVPNPYTNKQEEDLQGAKHIVDLVGMLAEKTKGNLSPEEVQLLESVLYELRMRFMAKTNRIKL